MVDKPFRVMAAKGTCDFILSEAECSDEDDDELEGNNSEISDLIDDVTQCDQGNSLQLFAQQQANQNKEAIYRLKRKYASRKPFEPLPANSQAKKKRCTIGGYAEETAAEVEEVEPSSTSNKGSLGYGSLSLSSQDKENAPERLIASSYDKAVSMGQFRAAFGVGFNDLTRNFKSNKTCGPHWVAAVFAARDELLESSKVLLQQYCDYVYISVQTCPRGWLALYLLAFKNSKNRDTVGKLLCTLLNVDECQLLLEPPKIRSVPAALYWYKNSMSSVSFTWGEVPDWIKKQTIVSHLQEEQTFELCQMVQWAYDNNYTDEAQIAYEYARLAEEDPNARAWLKCNNQAKHVRECAAMTKYYKKGEMREMTLSAWLKRCVDLTEGGDWTQIVKFLRFQELNFVMFLAAFKDFLHGKPKKNCILLYGPPNTGKSMFLMSFCKAVQGKVLSFVNSKSQFWLQPIGESKFAVLDDATHATWLYFDTYLRNGLDGNVVCLDAKHRAPSQVTFPPLMVTSNININEHTKYYYLQSRIACFHFKNEFPLTDDGAPGFDLSVKNWNAFFRKLWKQLDLKSPEEEFEDGEPPRPFRCCTESATGVI